MQTNSNTIFDERATISVVDLSRRFKKIWALKNVSFDVRRGQTFAILGHNGAGKTTLIKILLGLLKPTSGRAYINGYDTWPIMSGIHARKRMGVVMEENGLYEKLTVLENLDIWAHIYRLPGSVWKERAQKLLCIVGLSKKAEQLVGNLSAGMKRKLAIIRALLCEPEIIVLDEPTAGLDAVTRVTIRNFLQKMVLEKGTTILIATQDLFEAEQIASHVAFIRLGEVVYTGSLEKLYRDKRLCRYRIPLNYDMKEVLARLGTVTICRKERSLRGLDIVCRLPEEMEKPLTIEGATMLPASLEDIYIDLAESTGDVNAF
ncbi:MAG: ABC transporter ATP-binding protein [Planctomycetota bacterium]|nr:ABC transporter ATP-binding protein [Planctomycetota bacterium]